MSDTLIQALGYIGVAIISLIPFFINRADKKKSDAKLDEQTILLKEAAIKQEEIHGQVNGMKSELVETTLALGLKTGELKEKEKQEENREKKQEITVVVEQQGKKNNE